MRRELLKNNLIVSALNISSLIANFLSQIVIASYFGANEERDAFFAASALPAYVNAIISGSLIVIFLPKLVDIKITNEGTSSDLISGVFSFMSILLLVIILPLIVFSNELLGILFSGFNEEDVELTERLLLALLPALIFQAFSNIIIAVHHSNNVFFRPSLSFIITPVVTILTTLVLQNSLGIISVAVGTSLGWMFTLLFLHIKLETVYKINIKSLRQNSQLRYCLHHAFPLLLGGLLYRGNTVIERVIASNFSEGAISYLGYAGSMVTILSSITINGIATTMFPLLSQAWSEKNKEKLSELFCNTLKVTFALCVPIIIITVVFAETIIATLFQRGAFNPEDTHEVSQLLQLLMASFLFLCMNNIPGKLIYITGTSRFGFINALVEISIYISLSLILTQFYSYYGIAYAQIIAVASSTFFASLILHLKFGIFSNARLLVQDFLKIIACAIPAIAFINIFKIWFEEQNFVIMLIFSFGTLLVYFYSLSFFFREAMAIKLWIYNQVKKI